MKIPSYSLIALFASWNTGVLVEGVLDEQEDHKPLSLRGSAHLSGRKLQGSSTTGINGQQFPGTKCLDDQFIDLLTLQGIPGGSVSVMKNGEVVYKQGYGTRDAPNVDPTTQNRPFLPSTPSRVFSISKVLTAMTVLLLAQDGRLGLDDLVFAEGGLLHSYIQKHEEMGAAASDSSNAVDSSPYSSGDVDPRFNNITIRQLLDHTAGFTVSLGGDKGFPFDLPVLSYDKIRAALGIDGVVSCPDIIQFMVGVPLMNDPGTTPEYSNTGYCVLQDIIEKASGMSYRDAVNSLLLKSLDIDTNQVYPMKTARLEDAKPEEAEYLMQNDLDCELPSVYDPNEGNLPCAYGGLYNAISSLGYAAWVASPQELVKLGKLLGPPDCEEDDCLIQEPWRSEMLAKPAPWPADAPLWVGLGWWVIVDPTDGSKMMYHEGGGSGGTSYFIHKSKYSVAFVMNGNNDAGITNYETGESKIIEIVECVNDEDWPDASVYSDDKDALPDFFDEVLSFLDPWK